MAENWVLISHYPDLELGNEFWNLWNQVWVPGACYKSLGLPLTVITIFDLLTLKWNHKLQLPDVYISEPYVSFYS